MYNNGILKTRHGFFELSYDYGGETPVLKYIEPKIAEKTGYKPINAWEGIEKTIHDYKIDNPIKYQKETIPYDDIPDINLKETYDNLRNILPKILKLNEEIDYKLFLLWCFSTWKYDSFNSTGYLAFYPKENSRIFNIGKSTALLIIEYLGNRATKAIENQANFNKMMKKCKQENTCMLIDETQDCVKKAKTSGADAYVWLKTTYSGENYRFKALAGSEMLPADVMSRCVEEIQNYFDILLQARTELFIYSFFYPDIKPYKEQIGNENRTQQIFTNLITMARELNLDYDDIIKYSREREKQFNVFSERDKIINIINNISGDYITVKELYSLLYNKEGNRNDMQRFGFSLKKYNIHTYRMNFGMVVKK